MAEISTPNRIVVACTDKPGKLLLSLPIFQTLKKAFPQAKITAFVQQGAEGFLLGNPAIDAVETLSPKQRFFPLVGRFRQLGADIFIHVTSSHTLVLAAWLAKIPTRIGMEYKWHGFFLTRSVKINRAVSDRNEVEYNFELLKPLGVETFATKTEFPLTDADKTGVQEILTEKGIVPGVPYVLVHPGSKGHARHWKAERYGQLLNHLCQIKGLRVVVTAEADEMALVSEVTALLYSLAPEQKPAMVTTGDLSLGDLAALCQGALCLLSGPTGPMQLAAAVGTPTVTIFSPAPEATPVRWGPWGNEHTVLIPQNPNCMSCQSGYCKKHDPMDALTVPEVFEAMKKYINRKVPF